MLALSLSVLAAIAAWWLGTGLLVRASGFGAHGRAWVFTAVTLASLAAVIGLVATAAHATPTGAYIAFVSAIALWSWHEASFLFGYVTGPRKTPCPAGAFGLKRFVYAAETLIHHELALFATAIAIAALTWGAPNQIGIATFGLLWLMRLSAKFNLYFGVSNFADDLLPTRLAHLKSYFGPTHTSALLPVTAILAILIACGGFALASADNASAHRIAGGALVGALATLAALEHLFLVLPVRESALWRFALSAGDPRRGDGAGAAPLVAVKSNPTIRNAEEKRTTETCGRRR